MDALLRSKSLPPGFRFHPTDEELFMFYLKRKVLGKSLGHQVISELDVFCYDPWDLPAKACLKTRDLNWYFLSPRSKKYPNGGRCNRATTNGYWKSTGNDRPVCAKNRHVGKIKTLVFHKGKPPKGERTDWVLHEYRLEDRVLFDKGVVQDSHVLCKVFEKSGPGPKNGENYGAPFVEDEWDSDDDNTPEPEHGLGSVITGTLSGQDFVCPSTQCTGQQPQVLPPIEFEEDELDRLLALFAEGDVDTIPESGSFSGLESHSPEAEFDWSQFRSDDHHYLELRDLNK